MGHDDEDAASEPTLTATPAPEQAASVSLDALERRSALGRYVVIDRLGSGGMGVVYSAYDPELGRKVAIKVLSADAQISQARLRREAQAMARLQHPNVIAVYDVGVVQERVFIAMELVEGPTLSAWLTADTRSWQETLELFLQAGRGLAAAHAVGLVHRDFKPGNVLVGSGGRARVGDFGLARAADDAEGVDGGAQEVASLSLSTSTSLDETLTHTGALIGTPSYMSPEQFQRQPADARSDQFSFCVALYRALFRQRPFAGEAIGDLAASVTAGELVPAPRDSRVPAWLQKAVLRGLATDPSLRWPSMDALLSALARDPDEVRRRKLLVVGAVTIVVAVAASGWALLQQRHRALCGGAAQQLAGLWDDDHRQAVRASFRATGAPFADDAFALAARALDGFAASWVATRTDACAATRIRGEQSEELLDLRMECLAERRARTQALVDLFTHADAQIVERSATMSSGLADLSECSDLPRLRSPVRLPADATARAAVEALRERLARLTTLVDAGKFDEALPLAQAVTADATRLGHAPTRAAALQLLGTIEWRKGKLREAESTFVAAAAAAVRGHDDTVAARAWTSLLRLLGGDLQRFDDADRWALFAEATIDRLGSDELRASFLQARSTEAMTRGRYESSLADAEQVLQLREKLFGSESVPVADALTVVGNSLYRLNRNEEALRVQERALALRTKVQGADHPDVGITLVSMASALQILGRYDEELADFKRALAIHERTAGPKSPQVAVVLDNIGLALAMQEHDEESLGYHRRAVAIYDELGNDTMARAIAIFNVGDRLMHLHHDAEAVVYLRRALAMEE